MLLRPETGPSPRNWTCGHPIRRRHVFTQQEVQESPAETRKVSSMEEVSSKEVDLGGGHVVQELVSRKRPLCATSLSSAHMGDEHRHTSSLPTCSFAHFNVSALKMHLTVNGKTVWEWEPFFLRAHEVQVCLTDGRAGIG